MRFLKLGGASIALVIVAVLVSHQLDQGSRASVLPVGIPLSSAAETIPAAGRYRLDDSQSKFVAHAMAGGLFWFKGHDHVVAVREFTGEAQLDPDSIAAASLLITAPCRIDD
jgi:hypothetical protein